MKHNKYNRGTRKVDPSAVSNAIIHTADTIAPWAAMLFGRGTMEVPGYRRGSSVVLTEEERKRREEARKAGANNTSGGRNAGRDNLSKEDFEWQPPAMLNIPPNPNSADAPVVVGEEPVWRTNQMRGLHPGTDQGTAPTVATGTPVQHPNASAQAQQTEVMNLDQRAAYWRDVWNKSGGMDRNAEAQYKAAIAERQQIKDNQAAAVQASDANQAAAWMQQSADPAAFDNTPSDAWTQAQQEALQSEPPKPNAYSGFSTKDLVEMYSRDPSPELADELQSRPDLDQGIEEAKSYVSSGDVEGRQVADEKAARDAEKADALRIEKEKQAALIDKKREEGTLTQFDIDKDKD